MTGMIVGDRVRVDGRAFGDAPRSHRHDVWQVAEVTPTGVMVRHPSGERLTVHADHIILLGRPRATGDQFAALRNG